LFPVVNNPSVPVAVIAPEVVRAALFETETLFPVDVGLPMLRAAPPVPTQLTLPVVLKVKLLVVPVTLVMAPEPEDRFKFVAVIEPPVCVMIPEPLAVKLTVVAVVLNPRETFPLFAVVASVRFPDAERAVVVKRALLLLTARVLNVAPPDDKLIEPTVEFTTVAAPVVLSSKLGVELLMLPMVPDPDVRDKEVVPVSVPAD
jgi:hypothetical protein